MSCTALLFLFPVLDLLRSDLVPLSPSGLQEPHHVLVVGAADKPFVPELFMQKWQTRSEWEFVFVDQSVNCLWREHHVSVAVSFPHLFMKFIYFLSPFTLDNT